jgi:hypothetical protein
MTEIAVSVDLTLDPHPTLYGLLVDIPDDACLVHPALAHALAEALDGADFHPGLAEILARDVDLGLLAGAAEGYVGVLAVGLPAADQDA